MTSYPSSSSEDKRAGSAPSTAGRVPGGTPSISWPPPLASLLPFGLAAAVFCSGRSVSLGLVVLCPLLLRVERTLTILVRSSLWTLTGFLPVCPGPHVELPCRGGVGKFPICLMQSSLASIFGVNVGVSPALFLPFLSFATVVSFSNKLTLANFLEGQTVHGL